MGDRNRQKAKARDSYREFAEHESQIPFDRLNDSQKSRQLGWFFLSKIYGPLHRDISIDDFEDGWVDGSSDLDVDFIHRDDGRVLIIQCRYRGTSHGNEKAADIGRFQSVLLRLANDDFKGNSALDDIAREIDWDNDYFELLYVTFGTIQGQALDQTSVSSNLPERDGIEERAEFTFIDESQLNELFRQALSASSGIPDKVVTLVAVGDPSKKGRTDIIEFNSGDHRSCLMVVAATQLTAAYQQQRDALFSLNIRNFLGSTKQNKKIIETAQLRPQDFFYFNNGISCIAESFQVRGDRVEARKMQVINGAQTVKALYKSIGRAGLPAKWHEHNPYVLVRITEVGSRGYGGDGRFRNEITRYNNTQNVIKDADFRANDSVHESLAAKFAENYHQGKKVVYQAKRTDQRQANSEVIRVDEFAKRVFSFLEDPVAFSGSTSMLFDEEKGYVVVFGDGASVWAEMPDREFKLRASIWWLAEAFTSEIKIDRNAPRSTDEDKKIYASALERKWYVLFAAKLILARAFGSDEWRARLEKLYKGDWRVGEAGHGAFVRSLYQLARQAVVTVYRRSSRESTFNHRQWMRARTTVEELREYASDLTDDQVMSLSKIEAH